MNSRPRFVLWSPPFVCTVERPVEGANGKHMSIDMLVVHGPATYAIELKYVKARLHHEEFWLTSSEHENTTYRPAKRSCQPISRKAALNSLNYSLHCVRRGV